LAETMTTNRCSSCVKAFLIFWLVAPAFLIGCGEIKEGREPVADVEGLVNQGKAFLELGDGKAAHATFVTAQTLSPQNTDAAFGILLSDVLLTVKLVESAIDFAKNFLGGQSSASAEGIEADYHHNEQGAGDTIHYYLKQIFDPVLAEMIADRNLCYKDAGFAFEIRQVPIYFMGKNILTLKGPWDRNDLVWLDGVLRLMDGAFKMIYSMDLNFDFGYLFLVLPDLSSANLDVLKLLDDLIGALYQILHDPEYPDFLLTTDEAIVLMPEAGVDFGLCLQDLVEAQRRVALGMAMPAEGILSFEDLNGNGVKDPGENFTINGAPVSDQLEKLLPAVDQILWDARASLLDGSPLDVDPNRPNTWNISDLNLLIAALLGFNLPIVPDMEIDLGGFFADPYFSSAKNLVTELVDCAYDESNPADILLCLLQLIK